MLRTVKSLEGLAIDATDGRIGKVRNVYFDDETWVVRYFVVGTSEWLGCREVLISRCSISQPDWTRGALPTKISKQQVKDSPSIDTHKPVSRQFEKSFLGYYGYPYYWGASDCWAGGYYPADYLDGASVSGYSGCKGSVATPVAEHGDTHLRSCNEVKGYHLKASDGEIGHVQGFLMDDSTWSIRYLIAATSNWWGGHQFLLSPDWIEKVSWCDSDVVVSLDRHAIKGSPAYDPDGPCPTRDEEKRIYSRRATSPAP